MVKYNLGLRGIYRGQVASTIMHPVRDSLGEEVEGSDKQEERADKAQ